MRVLWSIILRGPKTEVLDSLSRASIPDHARAQLSELVNASPHAGVAVDSHAHQAETLITVTTSIAKLY